MSRTEICWKVIVSLGILVFFGYILIHMFQGEFSWLSLFVTICAGLSLGGYWFSLWSVKR